MKITEAEILDAIAKACEVSPQSNDGMTGTEIYNRHADAKDDSASMAQLVQWMTDLRESSAWKSREYAIRNHRQCSENWTKLGMDGYKS